MKELIPVRENVIGNSAVNGCEGRRLHEFLGIQTRYDKWFNRRVDEYGFVEGKDFCTVLVKSDLNLAGGRPSVDHFISIDITIAYYDTEKRIS